MKNQPIKFHDLELHALAATTDIDTPEFSQDFLTSLPVAAAVKLLMGTLGALDDAGNVNPAADTAGLRCIGRIEANLDGVSGDIDNTGGIAGAMLCHVKKKAFAVNNSNGNPLTAATVGRLAYVQDNQTVCTFAGSVNKVVAGLHIGFSNIDSRPIIDFAVRPATELTPN